MAQATGSRAQNMIAPRRGVGDSVAPPGRMMISRWTVPVVATTGYIPAAPAGAPSPLRLSPAISRVPIYASFGRILAGGGFGDCFIHANGVKSLQPGVGRVSPGFYAAYPGKTKTNITQPRRGCSPGFDPFRVVP